ncbi:MAG: type II toxin-antitoxin system Phd/YefM family antitoxin [bacterium]|nr:type II toxin-antitoxin system Phd/YefM family antitoxin [bacterium]
MSDSGRRPRTIPADEFKNRCLELVDEVNETGEEIVITKHGKPVSRLVPPERTTSRMFGRYREEVRILGDILSPATPAEDWEVISNPDRVLDPTLPIHQ